MRIASGHAWRDHQDEFDELTGPAEFAALIEGILLAPDQHRLLARGRSAYWDGESATIVIVNPSDRDGGTTFRPKGGRAYFDAIE